ncbi:MAG: GldG family protein [Anaerolineae bacterium]
MQVQAQLRKFSNYIILAGILSLLAGVTLYAISRQFDTNVEALLAMGLALVGLFILAKPEEIKRAIIGRTVRYGSNAGLMIVTFLGIIILVNFMADRHHQRLDWTEAKEYSLSPQTLNVLEGLEEPVKIIGFFDPNNPYQQQSRQVLEDLLKEYAYHSDKVSYEFVDPDAQPLLARQYEVTSYGSLVFIQGDKYQNQFATDEQDITSGILKVSQDEVKAIYFTTGHKEHDPDGFDEAGYSQLKDVLEDQNYKVETLSLATITDTLPTDTAVVVIAGPQVPFEDRELETLKAYLSLGGKALILGDPNETDPLGDLLTQWGIRLRNDLVIDPIYAFFGDVASPLVTEYRFSQITKDLGGLMTYFRLVCSVEQLEDKPENVTITPLIETSDASWGEMDLKNAQRVRYDEGTDVKGPLTIAATVEENLTETRLVILGDSDLVSNSILTSIRGTGNIDFVLNAVNWLAEEEELIAIGPKTPQQRPILLTPPQSRFIAISSIIFLPLIVVVAGVSVWWNRR